MEYTESRSLASTACAGSNDMRHQRIDAIGWICIVDDDAHQREMLREILMGEGYAVSEASDGSSALALLRSTPHRMVVLLDQVMPGLDGAGVLSCVAADPHLRAQHSYILLSARWHLPPKLTTLTSTLSIPIIAKPYDLEMLLSQIAQSQQQLAAMPGVEER